MNPFSNWGPAEVEAHNSRVRKENRIPVADKPVERERDLHDDIEEECKRRGWYYVHSRMDKKTTCGTATPDFIIAAPGPRTFWIECKAKGKKPTTEQLGTICWLKRDGHIAAVIWSIEDFHAIVSEAEK